MYIKACCLPRLGFDNVAEVVADSIYTSNMHVKYIYMG